MPPRGPGRERQHSSCHADGHDPSHTNVAKGRQRRWNIRRRRTRLGEGEVVTMVVVPAARRMGTIMVGLDPTIALDATIRGRGWPD
ncbi:MAG: hypothetical protein M1370_07690 [Bacteroidetes bacterium]|nr:hypothetical protein [Bacteroidota bacterium]